MKKISILFLVFWCMNILAYAQNASYKYLGAEVKSPTSVFISLKTFAEKKKTVDLEAKCAALRIIMFEGLEGTIYSKPLLNQGTISLHENEEYFNNLFNYRLSEVIKTTVMKSDFKKAEKGEKSTLYVVEVNYILLKKDLEKNKIKKQLSL